jgi:hypothetical protein
LAWAFVDLAVVRRGRFGQGHRLFHRRLAALHPDRSLGHRWFPAGRLRVKWAGLHTREVYFRDTAHGLLAWAVASLATAALLGSAVGSVISGGAKTLGAAGGVLGTGAAATAAAMALRVRNRPATWLTVLRVISSIPCSALAPTPPATAAPHPPPR